MEPGQLHGLHDVRPRALAAVAVLHVLRWCRGDMVTLQGWIYHLAPPDVAGVGGVLGVEVEAAGVEEVLPVLGPGQGGHHVQGAVTHLTSHHDMT